MNVITKAILFVVYFTNINGAPISSTVYVDDKTSDYLVRFGYLYQTHSLHLRTVTQLQKAIINLQRFGGVPITGRIDEATKRLMKAKRCGLPDDTVSRYKRFAIYGRRWPNRTLTWSLRSENPNGLNTDAVRSELRRALDLWAKHSKLTFREVSSDRADIRISFHRRDHGDQYPFDGRGQILAHAFLPSNDPDGGDVHLDGEELWLLKDHDVDSDINEEGTSLFDVTVHEFGHSLGLWHSSVQGSLMYPWYQKLRSNEELPDDDRYGIQQTYGVPDNKK